MMTVKIRRRIERDIVQRVVNVLQNKGYTLEVENGEDEAKPFVSVNKTMFQTDDEEIWLSQNGKRNGFVAFIYGNDGYDVIHDYSINLETVLSPVFAYITKTYED